MVLKRARAAVRKVGVAIDVQVCSDSGADPWDWLL